MYVLEEDKKVIEEWAKKKNISISFRAAGEHTLNCLERGAGAKPHEILDKTLKCKSEKENGTDEYDEMVKAFIKGFQGTPVKPLLMGLVGHKKGDCIDGIYLTKLGEQKFEHYPMAKENRMPYLLLATPDQKKGLVNYYQTLCKGQEDEKAEYLFSRLFFSGDYDVHDMLQAGGPVSTKLDMEKIKELQEMLIEARKKYLKRKRKASNKELAEETSADYQRVQHGPQANYIAQMINENRFCKTVKKLNVLVEGVAAMSPPVIVYEAKEEGYKWKILESDDDIAEYYKSNGITVKSTWRETEKREQMIRWTIKNAIRLICSKENIKEINSNKMIDQLPPTFEVVYGSKLQDYVQKTLNEMVETHELRYQKEKDIYVKQ